MKSNAPKKMATKRVKRMTKTVYWNDSLRVGQLTLFNSITLCLKNSIVLDIQVFNCFGIVLNKLFPW